MAFSGTYTQAALLSELNADPKGLGYSTWIPVRSTGGNQNIAGLLNATSGNGSGTVSLVTMTSGQIAAIMMPLFGNATTLTAAKCAWYSLMFAMIMSQPLPITVSVLANFSNEMVSDGIMTSGQQVSMGQTVGSRAQVLWGQNVVVSEQDVEAALGESLGD